MRRFFVLEYRKKHFPALFFLKKKVGKMAIFGKMSIFLTFFSLWTFSTSCFYSLEKRFFVLQYRNRHFPGLFCLKKKVGKMAFLGPKPWVNPFGKISICRLFELLFFIA